MHSGDFCEAPVSLSPPGEPACFPNIWMHHRPGTLCFGVGWAVGRKEALSPPWVARAWLCAGAASSDASGMLYIT